MRKNEVYLCLDIGTKYIGCAISYYSNKTKIIKQLNFIRIKRNKISYFNLELIIKKWKPNLIVVGKPNENQFIFFFIKKLAKIVSIKYEIDIKFVCEHLTSWEAKNTYKKKHTREINDYSALLILKSFLSLQQ